MEFMRKLAALVPPPRSHRVRYSGVFGPAARMRHRLLPPPPAPQGPPGASAEPAPAAPPPPAPPTAVMRQRRLDWAALLQRVHAVDVLSCGRCGGRMRVMAFVTDPDVARAILEHLHLPAVAPPQALARGPPQSEFAQWDQSNAALD